MRKLLALALLLGCVSAQAQQIPCPTGTYTISGSEQNTISGCGVYPLLSIDAGGTLINTSSGELRFFEETSGGEIQNAGFLNNEGSILVEVDTTGSLTNDGTINNSGSIGVSAFSNSSYVANTGSIGTSTRFQNYGEIVNGGFIGVYPGGINGRTGSITNTVTGELRLNGSIDISTEFVNHGTISNDGTTTAFRFRNATDGSFTSSGLTRAQNTDGYIINDGDWVNSGELIDIGAGITNNGVFGNTGTIDHGDLSNTGAFTNSGLIVGDSISNSGILINAAGGSMIYLVGNIVNTGSFTNNGALTSDNYFSNSSEIDNAGDLTAASSSMMVGTGNLNQSGGTMTLDGTISQSEISVYGGSVFGSGSIHSTAQAMLIASDADLNPGNSVGRMRIVGDLDLEGALKVEIEALLSHDVLDVGGLLDLSSTSDALEITFLGDYMAAEGDSFQLLTADSIIGEFDNFYRRAGLEDGLRWSLEYQLDLVGVDVVTARVEVVPIPAAAWLFASCLGLLGWIRLKELKNLAVPSSSVQKIPAA